MRAVRWSGLISGLLLSSWVVTATGATPPENRELDELPIAELERFSEVYGRIKRDYVEEIDDETLFRAAIRGMLTALDDHSRYLDLEALEQLEEGTRGEFGGVGLELSRGETFVEVVAPIDDTPASKVGLLPGDRITRIDGKSVRDADLSAVVEQLRGKPGTRVEMTVVRDEETHPLTFELERAIIKVESVRGRLLAPGIGYIRISQFQERTGNDLQARLDELVAAEPSGLDGLILDLRNNPGGVLHTAVAVADAFLSGGLIVYTEGRFREARMEFEADPVDHLLSAPLVVLVNRGSASGSEIVAGALQDRGRAVIMGQSTFGKGSVQSIIPLDGPGMKMTTARYYTPAGRSIENSGIQPDIVLDNLRLAQAETPQRSAEAELAAPLRQRRDSPPQDELSDLAERDYVLFEALNLLRGLRVLEGRRQ